MPVTIQGTNSAATPALSGDSDSGVVCGSNQVDISTGGTSRATIDSTSAIIRGDLVRLMNSAGSEVYLEGNSNGNVELYYDNALKLATTNDGITMSGWIYIPDGAADGSTNSLRIGNGADLKLFHDGDHSYIEDSGTGELRLRSNQFTVQNAAGTETLMYAIEDGSIGLKYNNELRLTTINTGVCAESDTTSHPGVLKVKCTVGASSQGYIGFEYGSGPTSGGGISRNGTSQTPEFYSGSDRRIKKNIVNLAGTLSKLNQIQLKSFKYKDDPDAAGIGPIAQDLISVFPDKVTKSDGDDGTGDTVPDGAQPWTVGTGFTWEIIKAIQELSAEVETLKTKVATLEAA